MQVICPACIGRLVTCASSYASIVLCQPAFAELCGLGVLCRQEAFLELSRLLITSLVLPAQASDARAKAFTLDKAAGKDEADLDPHADGASEQNAVGCVALEWL